MGKAGKKVIIYSPYWHILGGGERYLLQIAKAKAKKHRVFLVAHKSIKKLAKIYFGIDLQKVEFLDPGLFSGQKFYSRFVFIRQFDECFYMTDGSLFFPAARKNYLIIQSPSHIPRISISTRFKISGWTIICYSSFMSGIIKKRLNTSSIVLPPAVDINQFKEQSLKKEKIFLTVGRFFTSHLHEKKHDFLIDFFNKNYKTHFKDWTLFVCGNFTESSGSSYLKKIKSKIKNKPVNLQVNVSFAKLTKIYQKSSIYWHAAGFGSNSNVSPEKMEHFGITTVEAMSAGCVPIVYNAGGQTDIVENNKNGYLWRNETDFLKLNSNLINNPQLMERIKKNAVRKSSYFSYINFQKKVNELV